MLTQLVSLPDTITAESPAECIKLPMTATETAISQPVNRRYQFAKLPGTFTGLPVHKVANSAPQHPHKPLQSRLLGMDNMATNDI